MHKLITLIFLCCPLFLKAQIAPQDNAAQQQKLNQVYRYLNALYVDDVTMAPLVEEAIRGMLDELDPHSAYLSADEMQGVQESFDGEFSGIGVEFNVLKDTVIVVNTIAGGPAERVGVMPNDRIVRIDTMRAVGFKRTDVPKYLRGKTGTTVHIEVVRHGEGKPLMFTIIRDKIPINTVDAAYKIDDHTGYIKVNRFGRTTMSEFYKAFDSFGTIDGLLLDLRGNGGGLLDQAIEMANFFLPKDALIVSTEGRAIPPTSFKALVNGPFAKGRLVVLIDENSASASEIVAGAVQDWDRGIIAGRVSFGKGLVQRQLSLSDGSAMRLTVARYHTPSGRVIQRPYENGKRNEYYLNHHKRFGAQADSLHEGVPIFKTLRIGRAVYGGGGITPDVEIPIDTLGVTPYLIALVRQGVVNEYVISLLDAQRGQLTKKHPTFDHFSTNFVVTEEQLQALTELGAAHGVPLNEKELKESKQLLITNLRANIAQRLYGMEAFYRIVNDADYVTYQRAVEVLKAWEKEGFAKAINFVKQ
ncbi:MAG: S41 family peptidase [Alistipes sp.]